MPAREKPMDVFGAHWENHFERIREDWLSRVRAQDIVRMKLDGTVMRVGIDHDDKGNAYGTVQVSNNDGISDVSFNADATRDMQVATLAPGTPVAWVVRPFVVFGVSKKSGNAYGFLKLNFLRDQLADLGK